MTEMVSGSPQTGGEAAGPSEDRPQVIRHGLTVERIFTTPGIHPYDEVSWERRDVVQTNWKTGESVFEQRGVEFPDFWSVIASTIVTTKYFRGAVGSDTREWSLRQLIDRVVRSYRRAGEDHGYFATPTDAEIFDHELTWMLLHQVFSFNSPVWFNVGTPAPQQVSACFILAVDDSMTSILNWYKEEGMIFKGGSGAGLNLSRIRSSKELLSSGGTASGPVSFMRGADASAGTIKSGGATRRAAKMVVLDVDHPDIEEFIETKAREEDKIRALRDAGFDMDLGGKDITSVQYQNANNSVRVSDEFMQSVEEGREFALRARADGSVVETVDAKGLFGKIALAAWRCADPGMQYDDTINDWHTSPETGRITASNPCFTGDTLVHTDKGLIQFDELLGRANGGEEFQVWTHDATNPDEPATRAIATTPEAYMITGYNPIIRLGFTNGMELKCTPSHRIWTTNRGYVEAENLSDDDQVLTSDVMTPAFNAADRLPNAALVEARALGESHDEMNLPTEWSYELAHYLGWLIGDGSTSQTVSTIYGSQQDRDEILPMHHEFIESINGGRPLKISEQGNGTAQLRLARGAFRRFLEGLGVTRAVSADKRVPSAILQAPPEFVGWFLQGLFDADGTAVLNEKSGSYVSLGSVSRDLLRDVQRLLSTFGISSRIYLTRQARVGGYKHMKPDGTVVEYDSKTSYQLRISRENVERFAQFVNFRLGAKAAVLRDIARSRTPRAGDPTTRLESRTDEGIQLTYNLSEPRNHSYIANGIVVRNCSEYMHLDNSSCNLASINLLKFLREDDTFDADKFAKVVEMVITAMDISICFADFPTEAIGDTTRKYRQLGIGYANLGALLMASGLAYDSDGGRALAASITSLMTGAAYRRSAELSSVVGPYEGYARNAEAHKRVMRKHASATDSIRTVTGLDKDVHLQATQVWADVLRLGESNGFRNAQASVLAPTGTIGLMMDCDTTGIEPDLALVKFKKLVGGGSLQIVNQTVPRALRKLGYTEETVEAIVEHISQHGNVVDAPGLKPEHYGIFDCAMGARTIAPMGHVRMMAAVQPFLSGAISKTVNMAETATVEEIEEIYFQGWKLGLKALAIYRDNCKVGQPLSDAKGTSRDNGVKAEEAAQVPETRIEYRPTRKRLPKNRPATTTSFSVGGAEGYMTASRYPDDGLGEIFLKMSKQGSTLAGMMDAFSIAVSIGLQYGVPLDTFVQKFVNMRFDPAGLTDDPDVRMAQSIMDYIFRRLALDYMPFDERSALGIYTADERKRYLETGSYEELDDESQADVQAELDTLAQSAPVAPHVEAVDVESEGAEGVIDEQIVEHSARTIEAHSSTELLEALQGTAADAPLCMTCGTKMRPAGSCYVCEGCGATSGCS